MFNPLSLRKAISLVLLLLTCLCLTGCYSMKTVSLNGIPERISCLIIHADDNYWTVTGRTVTGGILTAQLTADTVKVRKGKVAHIYIAPASSVKIAENVLSVPVANIGKTDYDRIDFWETLGILSVAGWLIAGLAVL